jgi:hypothetical protein
MPPPVPVKKPARQNLNEVLDFLNGSKKTSAGPAKPAEAVNTLGEVPDSEWFVNRHARHRMSSDELKLGPGPSDPPVPPFTVTGGKTEGVMPGFRMKDSKNRRYFVKVDPWKHQELATSSDVIVRNFSTPSATTHPKSKS